MADLNAIKQWQSVPVSDLGSDGRTNVVLDRQDAKVYANGDNKTPIHAFSVVSDDFAGSGNDKAFRTGR